MLKISEGKISYKLRKKAEQKVTVTHFSEMFHGQMRGSRGCDTGITDWLLSWLNWGHHNPHLLDFFTESHIQPCRLLRGIKYL